MFGDACSTNPGKQSYYVAHFCVKYYFWVVLVLLLSAWMVFDNSGVEFRAIQHCLDMGKWVVEALSYVIVIIRSHNSGHFGSCCACCSSCWACVCVCAHYVCAPVWEAGIKPRHYLTLLGRRPMTMLSRLRESAGGKTQYLVIISTHRHSPCPYFSFSLSHSLSLTHTKTHTAAHIRRRHIPSLQMAIFRHAHIRSLGMSVKIICHSVQAWVGDESGNGKCLKSALSHIKPADYQCDGPVPVSLSLLPHAILY